MSKIDLRLESVNADRRTMKILVQYDAIGLSPGSEGIYLATSGNTSGHFTAEDAKAMRDALIERYPLETPVAADIEELKARIARLEAPAEPVAKWADFDLVDVRPYIEKIDAAVADLLKPAPAPLFRKGERVRVLDAKGETDEIEPGAIGYVAEDYYDGNDDLMMVRLDVSDARVLRKDDYPLGFYADRFGADDTLQPGDRAVISETRCCLSAGDVVTIASAVDSDGDHWLVGGCYAPAKLIAPLRPSGV